MTNSKVPSIALYRKRVPESTAFCVFDSLVGGA